MSEEKFNCMYCKVKACEFNQTEKYPPFCLTKKIDEDTVNSLIGSYTQDNIIRNMAAAAAEIEGLYYGKITRVEEIILFSKKIGAQKIGIATCVGLMDEAQIFSRILKANGLLSYGVICKIGAVDKTRIGISEELKVCKGGHESMCNPILQAQLFNQEKTDLNVIIGLCVGHDSIFIKHSDAPVTTLITKDRVLGHNPVAALYTANTYYNKVWNIK